ncbi:MAG: ABC transporter ATP-binding protein [Acidimicrobiia bacterium]|nr:ABC transporter ATP-binding protein [Acidimicrobiia bacterium]
MSISKTFDDVVAVNDVSLMVDEGKSLVLLGPSGCGKTTLLRIIAGLELPDDGRVVVARDVLTGPDLHVPPELRRIGMVFQDWALFPHMDVARNVAFGLTKDEVKSGRVDEALGMVGLAGYGNRYPDELSGGQAQRVALARALAPRPRVMLFDEPFSNLDSELRAQVRIEVSTLLREVGMTSIYVTHDQEEAFLLGDAVAVMRDGRLLQNGTPSEIYSNPATPWVATFVGEANLVVGEAHNGLIATALGALPLSTLVRGTCKAVVRPEHLMVEDGSAGTITAVDFFGHDSSYRVAVDDATYLVRVAAAPRFRPGDKVSISYAGPEVVAFPETAA